MTGAELTIVLVDDHVLFREGLRQLLTYDTGWTVVGEGADGAEALRLVREHDPDVVLLDVEMPGQPAVRTVEQLRQAAPRTRIVVLTMHDDPHLVQELLSRGASAFLTKTVGRDQLLPAVRAVAHDSDTVLVSVQRSTFVQIGRDEPVPSPLSPREREVLRLLAQACSNARIAELLFITEGTVKRHLTNIYAKLNAVSRVDAILKANSARIL
ncbi:response regulator transcription factor [Dactylosporangium sp. NPDC050688]|uniref:response regulator transcription factor n=1 Tax=Dactylosporangium sp. NPDC050688 TaxID=3157217 RepID=UPI0033D21C02